MPDEEIKTEQLSLKGDGKIVLFFKAMREFGFPTIVAIAACAGLAAGVVWYVKVENVERETENAKIIKKLDVLKNMIREQRGCPIEDDSGD